MTGPGSAPAPASGAAVRLSRNPRYISLLIGQTSSGLESQISTVAYPLLVLALTGSAAKMGLVSAATMLGQLLIRLPGGALVDRMDRRRVMIVCDVGRVVAMSSILLGLETDTLTLVHLSAVAFVVGALTAVFGAAQQAALRHIVHEDQFPAAVAQDEARDFAVQLGGPPLGGLLYGVSRALPFVVDILSYVVSTISIILIRGRLMPTRISGGNTVFATEVWDGVRFVWQRDLIRVALVWSAGVNFVIAGLTVLTLLAARDGGATTAQIGVMFGLSSVGGLLGALIAARAQRYVGPYAIVVTMSWTVAVCAALLWITDDPYALGALMAGTTFLGPIAGAAFNPLLLRATPDEMTGRMTSALGLVSGSMSPAGPAVAGVLAQWLGLPSAVLGFVLAQILTAAFTTASRSLRRDGARRRP